MAASFIPNTYGADNIWNEAVPIAFTGYLEKCKDISNKEIADKLLESDIAHVSELLKGAYAQSTIDMNSSKTAATVMFVLSSYLNSLRLYTSKSCDSFSIRDFIDKRDSSVLFITFCDDLSSELSPL